MMPRVICAFAFLAMPAAASTLCDDLNALQSDSIVLSQGAATCRPSLGLDGSRNMHCVLEFPYRSQAARDAFDGVLHDLTACLGPDATQSHDQTVNHPDAYDLREFDLDGRGYGVSIKDKGALQQTLVFVRVQMP